ncbi:hypothetical protein QUF72_02665 [Desulfobacterales bacterium HSG2]|nr:hypothetical protein [Desulfobacterales bacterium HSG2]
MEQLFKQTDEDNIIWSTGNAAFRAMFKIDSWPVTVAVRCRVERLESDYFALLDTGAEWSMIGGDVLPSIEDQPNHSQLKRIERSLEWQKRLKRILTQ